MAGIKKLISNPGFSLGAIVLILVVVSSNINWGKDHWKNIIEADGKGYYAYLPAIFIYQDLNFGFFDEIEKDKYYSVHTYYDYRSNAEGKIINKYYAGTAVAQLPFFLIAHLFSPAFGFEQDGYSKLYTIFINLAGIFYLVAGLYFLNKLLKAFSIGKVHRTMTFWAIVFGTNLFFYTVSEPAMSHIYSFAFIAMFLFYAMRFFQGRNKSSLILMAGLLGLIVLIRPVNGMILLALPFIAGSFQKLKKGFTGIFVSPKYLLVSIAIFFAMLSIQLIIYKISTGKFFVYAYGKEGFNFLTPHMIDILFSYRKGLFVYTPLYLLSMAGLIFLWKSNRFAFFSWLGFFVTITYVFSSWWMWYYGGSFSSRVYVEYLPMFVILLAIAFSRINSNFWKRVFVTAAIVLVVLCQVQTYQYRYNQIHWSEMDKEMYWDVFLRIDRLI